MMNIPGGAAGVEEECGDADREHGPRWERVNRLNARDRAILVDLVGEALAVQDETAVASAIDELREALPVFRREAARVLAEEVAR